MPTGTEKRKIQTFPNPIGVHQKPDFDNEKIGAET